MGILNTFLFLSLSNCLASFLNILTDCDEVYNYWEPMHYLINGFGMQTWEYSPSYGLRSYAYVLLYGLPGFVLKKYVTSKATQFFILRSIYGLVSAICETFLIRSLGKRFSKSVTTLATVFFATSTGMLISAPSFLPSTFSMLCVCLYIGGWLIHSDFIVVLSIAASTFIGWPFAVAISVPYLIDFLVRAGFIKFFFKMLGYGILGVVLFLIPMVFVDYYYYGTLVIAPLNIVKYNVFGSNTSSELYGVEDWHFYLQNLFLNFNFLLFAFALSPIILVIKKQTKFIKYLTPAFLWIIFMSVQPHKEERFMYVIYPVIVIASAISVIAILGFPLTNQEDESATSNKKPKNEKTKENEKVKENHNKKGKGKGKGKGKQKPKNTKNKKNTIQQKENNVQEKKISKLKIFASILLIIFLIVTVGLSISRTAGLHEAYGSPIIVWRTLYEQELSQLQLKENEKINICVGKSWSDFPSSFFLPNENFVFSYVESNFTGLLPKLYEKGENATRIIPSDMNNMNRQEFSRYIKPSQCNYLIDRDFFDQSEEHFVEDTEHWEIVVEVPYLNKKKTPTLIRSFFAWLPHESDRYVALKRKEN
ncbi:alpha-12-mannosyltransferase alg9 [Anaeramoeba flamelloides]|uniref:Mannosyltransferase n=1 Tax=Anaeramoeba flamelloides TaxID=1746091 RepID=A0AAV7YCX1_9EUKA|nr:alpha-12-mannosyltransferase alg9 [Anaeramoeba flamelloides]